jgi:ribosomal protein S18 acetylase RimI-like enzyme|tara:strand:+ start:266 stop:706 length:441 start_codon:yes stop_codon:yes gene_type:complete
MNVKFIKAIDEDAAEISQILEDWAASNREIPLVHNVEERADYGRWLLEHTRVTMIHNSSGVVGFLALEKHIIQALYIKKDFQGFGFGQAAIKFAQKQFKELRLWVFQSNIGAQKFYQRLGFQIVEKSDGEDNDYRLPDIFYCWKST